MERDKIFIGVVHNENIQRNSYLFPKIEDLALKLSSDYDVETLFVSSQPTLEPVNLYTAMYRDWFYLKTGLKWSKYRKKDLSIIRFIQQLKNKFIGDYLVNAKEYVDRWKKTSFVEMAVTDKHIRLWDASLEFQADITIVLEDDTIFVDESFKGILLTLSKLAEHKSKPVYVDLAGGCELSEIGVENLILHQQDSLIWFEKPVTNTACAYAMNNQMLNKFKSILLTLPAVRFLGIDWMMNNCFLEMDHQSLQSVCFHHHPPIFQHGSTTGSYYPWER